MEKVRPVEKHGHHREAEKSKQRVRNKSLKKQQDIRDREIVRCLISEKEKVIKGEVATAWKFLLQKISIWI